MDLLEEDNIFDTGEEKKLKQDTIKINVRDISGETEQFNVKPKQLIAEFVKTYLEKNQLKNVSKVILYSAGKTVNQKATFEELSIEDETLFSILVRFHGGC